MRFLPFTDITICAHETALADAQRVADQGGHDVTLLLLPNDGGRLVDFGQDLVDLRISGQTQADVDAFIADYEMYA